jgi:hypothetical protein
MQHLNDIESLSKVIALIAAALFFCWKLFTGWLIVNMQISIEASRQEYEAKCDLVTVRVKLDKGMTDTLWLRDASVRICSIDETGEAREILSKRFELNRLKIDSEKLVWEPALDEKKLTLSPGESLHFGWPFKVTAGGPLVIEAAVYGNRTFWRRGFQWRASLGCPPVHR